MSIRSFFSGEESDRGAPRVDPPARESKQALLLRLLREADGATVSYAELRDAGIELPASVVSELELAGIPIEHRYEGGGSTRRRPGVRLNPALDPERTAEDARDERADAALVRRGGNPVPAAVSRLNVSPFRGWSVSSVSRIRTPSVRGFRLPSVKRIRIQSIRVPSISRIRVPSVSRVRVPSVRLPSVRFPSIRGWTLPPVLPRSWRLSELRPATRVLAPIALVGAMVVVIAVVVLALQASSQHGTHRASKPQPRSTSVAAKAPQTTPPPTPSTPVSPALATQFEAEGHDLLQSGQYSNAIPVLRRALAATGKQLSDCLEPVSETCLTYAYALYDLGRALELNGEPSAAVPVLEQRLQIDNQRDVVAAELAHVRTIAEQQ